MQCAKDTASGARTENRYSTRTKRPENAPGFPRQTASNISAVSTTKGGSSAQSLARKDVSAAMALTIAQTAIATCTANGYRVSAAVVGRNGEVLVQIRGDGTGPHTMENSFKKAYTARTFRIPSGEMEERLKKNPQMGAQYLTGFTTARC
jgi:hypothetical protein